MSFAPVYDLKNSNSFLSISGKNKSLKLIFVENKD